MCCFVQLAKQLPVGMLVDSGAEYNNVEVQALKLFAWPFGSHCAREDICDRVPVESLVIWRSGKLWCDPSHSRQSLSEELQWFCERCEIEQVLAIAVWRSLEKFVVLTRRRERNNVLSREVLCLRQSVLLERPGIFDVQDFFFHDFDCACVDDIQSRRHC